MTLKDLVERTLAEAELPPDGELHDEWAKVANDPLVLDAWKEAFGEGLEDVQGYDEEWREMLTILRKKLSAG